MFAIRFINRAQQTIIPNSYSGALIPDVINLELKANKWTPIPGVRTIRSITKEGKDVLDFQTYGEQILVPIEGIYTLDIRRTPKPVAVETDVPEIAEVFHSALCSYVGAMELHRLFGSEDSDHMYYLQEFQSLCQEAQATLNKKLQIRGSRNIPRRPYC